MRVYILMHIHVPGVTKNNQIHANVLHEMGGGVYWYQIIHGEIVHILALGRVGSNR